MALPNYGIIEPAVFRSAFPTPDTFAHVRMLALRTVVNLSQEALTRAAAAFLAEQNVQVADVGLQVWTHPACEPISHELIKEALRYVLDKAHHPLLVVSASGTLVTTVPHYLRGGGAPSTRRACGAGPRPAERGAWGARAPAASVARAS